MTYIPNQDWYTNIVLNKVDGFAMVHKFGRNDSVPNGSWAPVNLLGSNAGHLQQARLIRVKAGNVNDDNAGGSGMRTVQVLGLSNSGTAIGHTFDLAGTSASSDSSVEFRRVFRAYGVGQGSYTAPYNVGPVVIEDSGVVIGDLIQIAAGEGQSQYCGYTVPLGTTAYIASCFFTVDASKAADLRLFQRVDAFDIVGIVGAQRIIRHFDGVLGDLPFKPRSPLGPFPALTDLWVEAQGGGAGTEVSADIELILVDD